MRNKDLEDIKRKIFGSYDPDITRLRQVLLNLGGNAIKFANEGEVAVKVTQGARDGKELVLHLTVSDTGIGNANCAKRSRRCWGRASQEGMIPLVTRYSLGDARDRSEILRILVVEDNLVKQRLVVRLLEKRGHRVVVAANGNGYSEVSDREHLYGRPD